nr:hypothetical protein GCM10020063_071070 [Dactylosporangium thailandense]
MDVCRRALPTADRAAVIDLGDAGTAWAADAGPAGLPRGWGLVLSLDRFTVRPCGPALCVAGQRTFVLDPASGTMLWTPYVRADLVAAPGGRLAVAGTRTATLLDPATGAPTPELPGWEPLGADADRQLLGAASGDDATLLGLRAGPGWRRSVPSTAASTRVSWTARASPARPEPARSCSFEWRPRADAGTLVTWAN